MTIQTSHSEMSQYEWWLKLLASRKEEGANDARNGCYRPPYGGSLESMEQDEDEAYRMGWKQARAELGDKFKWDWEG